jgi:single-strand DNA-binding protein
MTLPTITATGNLVFEPDFGVTANGISRCKMRIACNERKKQDGEWVDGETSYFDIIVWRGLADAAGDNFKKGQSILVVGKVKISKYEDKNGVERQSVEILAEELAAVVKGSKAKEISSTDDPWL